MKAVGMFQNRRFVYKKGILSIGITVKQYIRNSTDTVHTKIYQYYSIRKCTGTIAHRNVTVPLLLYENLHRLGRKKKQSEKVIFSQQHFQYFSFSANHEKNSTAGKHA
jgi:hypothetical protein